MGNRVVDMQQIQIVELGNLRHARGQRQIVGREVEQRITRHLNFVIVNVGVRGQAEGWGISNEVNFVPALRQLEAQLSGDHAAAAVGRITSDPYVHALA